MKENNEEISIWEVLLFFKKITTYSKKLFFKVAIAWVFVFVLGYIYYYFGSKSYKSEMYVSTKNMNREELSTQIIYLNNLIYYSNHAELASLLNISEKDAKMLQEFKIDAYIADDHSLETEKPEFFRFAPSKITLKAKSNTLYKLLNNTLSDYLNTTAYSEMLNSSQRERLIKLKNTYNVEIKKLDSLENNSSNFHMRKDDALGILFDGPSEVAKARINLIEKIAQTEKDLKTDIGVKIIKEFYIPSHPHFYFQKTAILFTYVILTVFSYYLVAFFSIIKEGLSEYENSK